jgi:hypothetical protein
VSDQGAFGPGEGGGGYMTRGYKSTHTGSLKSPLKHFTCTCGNTVSEYFDKDEDPVMECPDCSKKMTLCNWMNNRLPTCGTK